MTLTNLEKAVLDMFLASNDPVRSILREQVAQAVLTREETGVGFFIHFAVSDQSPRLPESESVWFSDVHAEIEGLEYGADFVLMVRNGVVDYLEGYTHADDRWPANTDNFTLSVSDAPWGADPKMLAQVNALLPKQNSAMTKPRWRFWPIWKKRKSQSP